MVASTLTTQTTLPAAPDTRELHITDRLLHADLSPLAKLIPAAILRRQSDPSYAHFVRTLPTSRGAIRPALDQLERAGFLTITAPNRLPGSARQDGANIYTLAPEANPRTRGVHFVRLPITRDLGRSPTRWLLRAVYLREQFFAGAIQLPDQIAARSAGMSVRAVKKTRTEWVKAGVMSRIADGKPATYTLGVCPEAYRADLDRFDPAKRKRHTIQTPDGPMIVWGTREQAHALMLRISRREDQAREMPALIEREGQPACLSRLLAAPVMADDDIPF